MFFIFRGNHVNILGFLRPKYIEVFVTKKKYYGFLSEGKARTKIRAAARTKFEFPRKNPRRGPRCGSAEKHFIIVTSSILKAKRRLEQMQGARKQMHRT